MNLRNIENLSFSLALVAVVVMTPAASAQQYCVWTLEPGQTSGSNAIAATEEAVVYGYTTQPVDFSTRAARWTGASMAYLDITPAGYSSAVVLGAQRGVTVGALALGSGDVAGAPPRRDALVWHPDGTVAVITPAGFNNAFVVGGSADGLAGYARPEGSMFNRALLWTGPSADLAMELHPEGYQETFATACDGDIQVGYGRPIGQSQNHAYLWHGSAASLVDLTPVGITAGFALSIEGDQIGGYIKTAGLLRAVIWSAATLQMTNLHFDDHESGIFYVNGGRQVGHRTNTLGRSRATLWTGTAQSATDLSVFLPSHYINSVANWISADSGRIVGSAFNTITAQYEAVIWQAACAVAGDVTGDNAVNVNDLLAVINAWGSCPKSGTCPADIAPAPSGDGVVNINDLLMVINNWG